MSNPWPEPVERVSGFLRQMGVEARIEEFPEGTPTAADAARAVGSKLGQIVKSLVFDCGGHWVVALIPGDRRADAAKIARAAGVAKAKIASPEQVEKATGFVAGAVAPFPLPQVDRVFVDRNLLSHNACGSEPAPRATWRNWPPPISSGSPGPRLWTPSRPPRNL